MARSHKVFSGFARAALGKQKKASFVPPFFAVQGLCAVCDSLLRASEDGILLPRL